MQQATIDLPSNHPVRAMTGLARQIALPSEYAPERFPSFPALERTAVMGFTVPASLTIPAGVETKVLLTRQAAWPAWAEQTKQNYGYAVTYITDTSEVNPAPDDTQQSYTIRPDLHAYTASNRPGGDLFVPGVAGILSSPGYPLLGVDRQLGPSPFTYLNRENLFYMLATGKPGVTNSRNYTITFQRWESPGEVTTFEYASSVSSGNSNAAGYIAPKGWIRPVAVHFEVNNPGMANPTQIAVTLLAAAGGVDLPGGSPNTAGSFALNSTAGRSLWPISSPQEFSNSVLPWTSTRLTAVSMLLTNVSKVLDKAGTVLAGRLNPVVHNPFEVASNVVNTLHPAEKAWLPLETGAYTYAAPSTDMSEFIDYVYRSYATTGQVPLYRLDNDAMYNVLYLTSGSADEVMATTTAWHVEFRTSSALFQVALSGIQLETLHQAQLSLAAAGYFFCNVTHKDILDAVIRATKKMAGVAKPYVVEVARAIHPMAGRVAKAILKPRSRQRNGRRKVKVNQGPRVMPPTSGTRSGIVTTQKKKGGLSMYLERNSKK